jgi:hypothetical protein
MKSDSASALELGKLTFLASIILAGIISIFIGLHAASQSPATGSAAKRARLGHVSDAATKVGQPGKPQKPIYSSDASDSGTLTQAARSEGKDVLYTSSPESQSMDTPGTILILLIIGVFGYIWVNADQLAKAHESDKIRINLLPGPTSAESEGVYFIRQPKASRNQ